MCKQDIYGCRALGVPLWPYGKLIYTKVRNISQDDENDWIIYDDLDITVSEMPYFWTK